MALLIVQGSTSYALSQQDLQRYPGSTLSSMVTSVSPQDGPVKLQADELQGSPLGDWPEAASITAALYRCAGLLLAQHVRVCAAPHGLISSSNVAQADGLPWPSAAAVPHIAHGAVCSPQPQWLRWWQADASTRLNR